MGLFSSDILKNFVMKPGEENTLFSYAMPWNWPAATADTLGLLGDTEKKSPYSGAGGPPSAYPSYIGMEPNQFEISSQFMGNVPLNKFSKESLRNGPSDMTRMALQQGAVGVNQARDQARRAASGLASQAQSNLSMKGGLGGGAAERIQKQAGDTAAGAMNAAEMAGMGNRANLYMADEAARNTNLGNAAGLVGQNNQAQYNMRAGDLTRKQGEYDRKNLFNMNLYNKQMEAWGAGKQADATANSGGKK